VYLPLVMGGCGYLIGGRVVPPVKYYLFSGRRVAVRQGCSGAVTWFYHDHLGSTVATSAGESTRYWPYGSTRTGAVGTPYRYTGQELDSASGLYYYVARWYDGALGRFLQPDTIVPSAANPQDLNRFSYARNNPVHYLDPDGQNPVTAFVLSLYALAFTAGYEQEAGRQVGVYAREHGLNEQQLRVMYRYLPGTIGQQVGIDYELCHEAGFRTASNLVAIPLALLAPVVSTASQMRAGSGTKQGLDAFEHAGQYGIKRCSELTKMTKGTGLFVHHLLEERFAPLLGVSPGDIPGIVLTKAEHQLFTNLWRQYIGYSNAHSEVTTSNATLEYVWKTAQWVYADHPQLLEAVRQFMGIVAK
jgi:RHS repeat-associated protein